MKIEGPINVSNFFTHNGFWFNPLSRQASTSITRAMHHNKDHFYRRIAQELAQNGEHSLHHCPSLEDIEIALGLREPPAPSADEAGMGSGIRLTQSSLAGSGSSATRQAVSAGTKRNRGHHQG